MTSIADLRREYIREGLTEAQALPDAIEQFQLWFDQAVKSEVLDANAMTLATVDEQGWPDARIVLIKGVDAAGITFFTNYESDKGRQLAHHPRAALVFWWSALERQVRVQGEVEKVSPEESQAYFAQRPRGSQVGAVASMQSRPIGSREALEQAADAVERKHEGQPVPRPAHWGGYRLKPRTFEFWQGRANRLHDRLRYSRQAEGAWHIERLSP